MNRTLQISSSVREDQPNVGDLLAALAGAATKAKASRAFVDWLEVARANYRLTAYISGDLPFTEDEAIEFLKRAL